MWRRSGPQVFALAALLAGCASSGAQRTDGGGRRTAVTVITANQLASANSLVTVLKARVGGAQIRDGSACPTITLRGVKSIFGNNNPVVYVDGVRASDTCVLTALMPANLDRIEIYSMGVGPTPRYGANANGLILVFSKGASRPQ